MAAWTQAKDKAASVRRIAPLWKRLFDRKENETSSHPAGLYNIISNEGFTFSEKAEAL